MPVSSLPIAAVSPGNVLTSTMWNAIVKDNLNKLLNQGHRVLTVAQFGALSSPEGTKGTVAPDEVYLEVDATNGIQWHLAYESGETTYKWRFLGGPPMYAEVATNEATASATYAALATAGPSITTPRAGDYIVEQGVWMQATGGVTNAALMSYDIGGTGAVDADAIQAAMSSGGTLANSTGMRKRLKAAIAASTALVSKYKVPGAVSTNFGNRWMTIYPVRIS